MGNSRTEHDRTRDAVAVIDLPVRMSAHVTRSDEAAAVVARDLGYDVRLDAGRMEYHHEGLVGDVVVQSEIVVDADLECRSAPNDSLMIVEVHGGSYRIDPWGVEQSHGAGSAFVLPPGQDLHLEVHRARVSTTVVPAAAVREIAAAAFDVTEADIRSDAPRRAPAPALRAWAAGAAFYRQQILGRPEFYRDDLLRVEATRQLVTAAIATFDLVDTATISASESAAVRRARAYIDDHLHEPLTLRDVAHAARIGERALQLAFQRERGQSPMAYVRAGRLAGAQADLAAADPGDGATVGAIAASWGFTNRGRFTAAYRAVYGVSPAVTLAD